MICLEVVRNGKRLCLAGLPEGMWSLNLNVSNPLLALPVLYVGGVNGEEPMVAVEWVREALVVGESVTFQLLDAVAPDPPRSSEEVDPRTIADNDLIWARQQHRELKDRLEEFEAQWGARLGESGDA